MKTHAQTTESRTQRKARIAARKRGKRGAAAAALAAGAAIAAGTQAYAAPVRFDNPGHGDAGHLHWRGPNFGLSLIDITLDHTQPGTAPEGPGVFQLRVNSGGGEYYQDTGFVATIVPSVSGIAYGLTYGGYRSILGVSEGTSIPGSMSFAPHAYTVTYPYYGYSLLPEGQPTFFGTNFDLGNGGYQYGWFGVVRSGASLEAFAWGYETTPGVSIPAGALPEPGTLALLAFGAAAALRRRRKT